MGFNQRCSHVGRLDRTLANDVWAVDMSRVAVEFEIVPVLHNVNLSLGRPRVTKHPEGWPGSASGCGQMSEVGDEEALVVRSQTLQSDTLATVSVRIIALACIGTNVDFIVLNGDQASLDGIATIQILDVT